MDKATRGPILTSLPEPIVAFIDDDRGYLTWITSHPNGYVLNANRQPERSYLVLHRATCPSISDGNQRWTSDYAKICSSTSLSLDSWLQTQFAASAEPCHFCGP
jgi:hypothetical protein